MYKRSAETHSFCCALEKKKGVVVTKCWTYIKWLTVEEKICLKIQKNIMSNRKDMILWNVEKSKILILCRTNKRMANFREREKICWTIGMLQILTSRVCKKNTYFSILCQYVLCIHCHFAPWTHENKYVFWRPQGI